MSTPPVNDGDPTGSVPVPQPPPLPGHRPAAPGGRAAADLTRTVLALAAELADLRAQLAPLAAAAGNLVDVAADVDELRAQMQDLAARLGGGAPAGGGEDTDEAEPGPGLIGWADMDAGQRADALGVVRDWVYEVLFVWHPTARTTLRPCWYRHRDVLSDTAALYEVWCWAYRDPEAPAGRREQWHSAWLPGWLERAKAHGRACMEGHDPRPVPPLGPEWTAGFDSYAAWFADPRDEPEPGVPARVPAARTTGPR